MIKTTVELPDDLLAAAKKRAAELRTPLRTLIVAGLRAQLAESLRPAKPRKIRWVTSHGGLPPGLDLSSRVSMYELISRKM